MAVLTARDLAHVSRGTPRGRVVPALLDGGAPERRPARHPRAGAHPRRGPGAVPRRRGPPGVAGSSLPPPGHLPGVRRRRPVGTALPVPRVAFRCRRRLPGAAGGAARQQVPREGPPPLLPGAGAGRTGLRLPRAAGPGAAAAAIRAPGGARRPAAHRGGKALRLQLVQLHRERRRPRPLLHPAPLRPGRRHLAELVLQRPGRAAVRTPWRRNTA